MDQSLQALVDLLSMAVQSKTGTVIAAAALTLMMWVLGKVPVVSSWLSDASATVKKVVMVFLAVAPAVVVSLNTKASWYEAGMTAVLTFLAAVGVQKMLPESSASA